MHAAKIRMPGLGNTDNMGREVKIQGDPVSPLLFRRHERCSNLETGAQVATFSTMSC
jgi:hypothetical protein